MSQLKESIQEPVTPKIALVHDDFVQWGGAERVMAAIAHEFPGAPIFTSMVTSDVIKKTGIDATRFRTSILDKLPAKAFINKVLFYLYPLVFEQFDFSDFDIVFSTSTRFAHGIVTKPTTKHISYIHSPFRGFWEPRMYFGSGKIGTMVRRLLSPLLSNMRLTDYISGQRADVVYGNSSIVVKRINKYHRRDAEVLFPFVDFERFNGEEKPSFDLPDNYMVVMSRLVEWKRIDVAIDACQELNIPLVIIGTGAAYKKLASRATGSTIMAGYLTDKEASYVLRHSVALLHPQYEDFGMTIIEANACGIPVVAYNKGGARDTVISNETGILFESQTADDLKVALKRVPEISWDKTKLVNHAKGFSREVFVDRLHSICNET